MVAVDTAAGGVWTVALVKLKLGLGVLEVLMPHQSTVHASP